MKHKFKTTAVTPQSQGVPQVKQAFGYTKIPLYKWQDGDNLLRFLPQPSESEFPNYVQFEELNFWSATYKNKLAMLPAGPANISGASALRLKCFFELREIFPEAMKSLKNPNGAIAINPAFKVGFQALDHNTGEVVAVTLPGTNPMPRADGTKRNVGAGTKVVSLCADKDITGKARYGDIFDIETGSLINIRVTNAGTLSATYEVLHECPMPLDGKDHEAVLDQIKTFGEVFKFATPQDLELALQSYLDPDHFDVVKKIFPATPVAPAIDEEDDIPY
jgi:hypothetical protein